MEDNWIGREARLIPVAGTAKGNESEMRATSALLAVLRVVRPFSKSLLGPLGASKADRATVDAYIEVPYVLADGRKIRPDGLIRVQFGNGAPWTALVEVKTGTASLDADQVNDYWDLANEYGYDCVVTISNEIAPVFGVHPTSGLKVRSNSRVKVHHFSWPMLLSHAVSEKQHRGVSDPEQAWILQELIRYLEHDSSGALELSDMGASWTTAVDGARSGLLTPRSEEVIEVVTRWDQLLRYTSLRLGREIGLDVSEVVPRKHRADPALRQKDLVADLCSRERLRGEIRIPNTAGDLDVRIKLAAKQIVVGTEVDAPSDKRAKARVTWLTRQLREAEIPLTIESVSKGSRQSVIAFLSDALEDPAVLLDEQAREPVKFRVLFRLDSKLLRRGSKKSAGTVETLIWAVESFYWAVLQEIEAYQPKPKKVDEPELPAYLNVTPQGGPVRLDPPPGFELAAPATSEFRAGPEPASP